MSSPVSYDPMPICDIVADETIVFEGWFLLNYCSLYHITSVLKTISSTFSSKLHCRKGSVNTREKRVIRGSKPRPTKSHAF